MPELATTSVVTIPTRSPGIQTIGLTAMELVVQVKLSTTVHGIRCGCRNYVQLYMELVVQVK